jgi:hypothetical protein
MPLSSTLMLNTGKVAMEKVVADQIYFFWQVFGRFGQANKWNIQPNSCK